MHEKLSQSDKFMDANNVLDGDHIGIIRPGDRPNGGATLRTKLTPWR